VTGDGFAEAGRSVGAAAVNEDWMEKHRVSSVHFQMHATNISTQRCDTVICLVHATFPVRVPVFLSAGFKETTDAMTKTTVARIPHQQLPLVGTRNDDKAAVFSRHALHGSPSTHNPVRGAKRKVMQVLVQGMA
jgi:hypothetical protein